MPPAWRTQDDAIAKLGVITVTTGEYITLIPPGGKRLITILPVFITKGQPEYIGRPLEILSLLQKLEFNLLEQIQILIMAGTDIVSGHAY